MKVILIEDVILGQKRTDGKCKRRIRRKNMLFPKKIRRRGNPEEYQ